MLVGHSMGGLIILRYLARTIGKQQGLEIRKVRGVVMLATPNEGSDILAVLRESASWWRHPQEVELREFNPDVLETRLRVMHSIVEPTNAAPDRCPIPIASYAAEEDNVVKRASARSTFPEGGTLTGSHFTIHQPADSTHPTYRRLRRHLLEALAAPLPAIADSRPASPRKDVYTELELLPPVSIQFRGNQVSFQVHAGPISQIRDVDIVVSSENLYFDIAKPFKPSTSGRLRLAAAEKNDAGDITRDVLLEEISDWMTRSGKLGLTVAKGTVAATSSGEMVKQGVKRIYHVAIVEPVAGSNEYAVSTQTIRDGVHNVFTLARAEREKGLRLSSIAFPLLGAGRGLMHFETSFETIWSTIQAELSRDPAWSIHFCTWTFDETSYVRSRLDQLARHREA